MDVRLKRIYEKAASSDGTRILVDRLWPRGISQDDARLDVWAKDVAPSSELRKSWHDDPDQHARDHFVAFANAYRDELAQRPASDALDDLAKIAIQAKRLTLLYGAKDTEQNHVIVLRDALLEQLKRDE